MNNEYRDENWQFQEWFFNIGYSVPYNSAIFSMVLVFSTVVPLVLPLGSIFFYVKYLLDKYNLIYVCPEQFESAGKISRNKPIYYTVFAVIMYQIAMLVVFIVTKDVIMSVIIAAVAIWGFITMIFFIRRVNNKLSHIESKKQRKVNIILNPKKNDSNLRLNNSFLFEEENHDELIDRLKNAYIHPCEKTFHAPVFKRRHRRSSIKRLFDMEPNEDTFRKARSEGDKEEQTRAFSSDDTIEESKSAHEVEETQKLIDK